MAYTRKSGKANETKKSVYEMVTEKIISELENGIIPWEKPWSGGFNGAFNRVSKRQYSLINQCMLKHSGEYATYAQWLEIDKRLHPDVDPKLLKPIKAGEKAEFVVFWKILPITEEDEKGNEVKKTVPMLRYFNVFHISQTNIEGLEPLASSEREIINPVEEAENIITDYLTRSGVRMERVLSDKAYYAPFSDSVTVPKLEQFKEVSEAYSTYFHELTHSTGHKSRLDRFPHDITEAMFGSESYSKEELVAEMGAAMILSYLGIESKKSFRNSTAYIQGWLKALKDDVRLITSASSKAEKAVKLILNEEDSKANEDAE